MNCTTCTYFMLRDRTYSIYIWFVLCIHLCVIPRSINIRHTKSHCAVQTFKTWNSSAISLSHLSYSGSIISDIWHSSCSESHLGSLNASKKHPWWPRPTRKTTVLPGQTAQKDTKGSYRCMWTSSSGWRMYIHGDRVTYPHGKRSLVHVGHTLGRHVDMETLGKIRETTGIHTFGLHRVGGEGTRDIRT